MTDELHICFVSIVAQNSPKIDRRSISTPPSSWITITLVLLPVFLRRLTQKDDRLGVREHLKCVWELKNWERRFRREYPSIPEMKGTFTAIILNYARPQNLDLLTRVLLNTPSVRRVVISNNDPVWNVHDWLHVSSDRVRVIEQSAKKSSATRALITRDESDTEHFLWMDDDIFLTPTQIEILCLELLSDPSAPHGICGQEWRDDGLGGYTNSKEGCIDVLNRVYACTKEHVLEFFRLGKILDLYPGKPEWKLTSWDDILLSFSGTGRPRVHNVGSYVDCPSQGKRGTAAWRNDDFQKKRDAYVRELKKLKSLS